MFRACVFALTLLGAGAVLCSVAAAQTVVVYDPVVPAVVAPTVTYAPVVTAPAVTTYAPVIAAPPTVVYRPMVAAYSPVVTTYTPVVTGYAPVIAGRPVLVRPKVYVAGQPVRNFFRAITP
jgi:hypothetical protein